MKSDRKKRILAAILCMVMVLSGNISALAEGEVYADPDAVTQMETPEAVSETQPESAPQEPAAEEPPVSTEPAAPEAPAENNEPAAPETPAGNNEPAAPETPAENNEPAAPETPEAPAEEAPVFSEETELTKELRDASGKLVQKVTAKLPKGAFKAETSQIEMEVTYVDSSMENYIKGMMEKKLPTDNTLGDYFLYNIQFKVNGEAKESLEPITITFENSGLEIKDTKKANVFFFDPANPEVSGDKDELVEITQRSELLESLQAAGQSTATMEEDYDLSSIEIKEENRSGKIVLEGRKSTIYGCYVEKEPEQKEEASEEQPEEKPADIPVLNYEDDKVTVSVTAEEAGIIPEGAELKVLPITSEDTETKEQYQEVEKKIQEKVAEEEKEVAGFLAYDITFVDKDGNEMEPNGKVKVSMNYKKAELPQEVVEKKATDAEVTVLHLEEDENGEVKQVVDMGAEQKANVDTLTTTEGAKVQNVEVETESFSVFTITWKYSLSEKKIDIKFIDYDTAGIITVENVESYNLILDAGDEFKIADITKNGSRKEYYEIRDTNGNTYTFHNMTNKKGDYSTDYRGTEVVSLKSENWLIKWRSKSGKEWTKYEEGSTLYITYTKNNAETELSTTATLDTSKSIKMQMFDYPNNTMLGYDSVIGGQYENDPNKNKGHVHQGLVQRKLSNGYPITNGDHSLSPLFTNGREVNHLFLKENHDRTGYYEYNSSDNYAYLEQNGNFTVYDQIGTPVQDNEEYFFQRGNFLPYTKIENGNYAKYGNRYDENGNKLSENHPRYDEPLYFANAEANNSAGFYFGMSLEARFAQPANGHVQNGSDMIYEFNGDDDLWVYIDDVLILDIGGEHDAHSGTINFATGEVVVDLGGNLGKQQTNIKELFQRAEVFPDGTEWKWYTDQDTISKYFDRNTFKDFTTHKMKMFYMERGAGASNLHMKFNLNVISDGQIQVKKELEEKTDPVKYGDVKFAFELDVEQTDADGKGTGTLETVTSLEEYKAYKNRTTADGEKNSLEFVKDEETGKHRFYLQPGEIAYFSIPKNLKYEVREVDVHSDCFDEVKINETKVESQNSDNITNTKYSYSSGQDTVSNRPIVTFINSCSVKNLRTLQIEKKMEEAQTSTDNFRILVELEGSDGGLHPYQGKYRVTGAGSGSESTKQTTDGYITLRQNEVANIYNILSDTKFKVTEDKLDKDKYNEPLYQVSVNSSDLDSYQNGQEGSIQLEKDAKVIVTNRLINTPPPTEPETYDDVPHHKYIDYLGDDGSNTQTALKGPEYYRLYLDVKGIPNEEPEPADIVLVLDRSNSMKENFGNSTNKNNSRWDSLKESAELAVETLLPNTTMTSKNRIGLVWFTGKVTETVSFTDDADTLKTNIQNTTMDNAYNDYSGTNYQDAFWETQKMLRESGRPESKKFVIFVTDGVPNRVYTGTPENKGTISSWDVKNKTIAAAKLFSGLNGFYALSVGNSEGTTYLRSKIVGNVTATVKDVLDANNTIQLTNAFNKILGSITKQIGSVTITDELSPYVNFVNEYGMSLNDGGLLKGDQNTASQIGLKVNISDYASGTYDTHEHIVGAEEYKGDYTYEIDLSKNTVKVNFGEDYFLVKDKVYTISFNVMLTDAATEEAWEQSEDVGDAKTDYPGNETSSGKKGFFANKEAKLKYKRVVNGQDNPEEKVYERPVVQPYPKAAWQIKKVKKGGTQPLSGATFTLTKSHGLSYTGTSGPDGIVKWISSEGTELTSSADIEKGTYILEETMAPQGYVLSSEKWTVAIGAKGMKPVIKLEGQENEVELKPNGAILELQIENTANYELPSTGGTGIFVYTIGGTLLLMAAALLIYKMKREEVLKG